jgi:hypothetical protein
MNIPLWVISVINAVTLLAVSELLRFHILLNFQGLTTLDYLKMQNKVSKESRVNVRIKDV